MTSPTPTTRTAHGVAGVTALAIATLGTALPLSMAAPTLSITALQYNASTAESSWVLTVTLLVATVSAPVIARAGDRYGPRGILLLVLPIIAAGLAIAGTATALPVLIGGRVLQGLGGGVLPLALALTGTLVPRERRAVTVGLLAGIFAAGTGLGAVIAGVLVDAAGTQALAWVPFAIVVLAEIAIVLTVPHGPRIGHTRLNLRSALALMVGVAALLLAVTEAPSMPHPVLAVLACVTVGAVAIAIWTWRELRRPDALMDAASLRSRASWAAHVTAFLAGAALFALFVSLPAYAESASGLPVTAAGLLLLPATAAMAALGLLSGVLRRRLGRRGAVLVGAALGAGGGLVLWLGAHDVPVLLIGSTLLGAGIAMTSAATLNVVVEVTPEARVAAGSSVNVVARQLGGVFGAAAAATVLAAPLADSFDPAFAIIAVVMIGAFAAALLIPGPRRR